MSPDLTRQEAIEAAKARFSEQRRLWEVVRKNVHRQTEQDGYICEHRNQHKTGWQCGRSATGLLTDE